MLRINTAAILNSFVHSSQLVIILRNIFRLRYNIYADQIHLQSGIKWLCKSQDNSGCGGSSALYGFSGGYAPAYPETTGYIISTFVRYADYVKNSSYLERAIRMGDWEIEIQLPSGAVRGGVGLNDYPIVFNTGMVILGWIDLYSITGYRRYLSASIKAADWLCVNIDTDGKWSKHTYQGIPHAYHSRVSWSLLEVWKHTHDTKYRNTALSNIKWVLSRLKSNGWIDDMGFIKGEKPFTHTIAYTLRGLLECSSFFDEDIKMKCQNVVEVAAHKILLSFDTKKRNILSPRQRFLSGRYDSDWKPVARYSCLTGDAQLAIIWLKLYQFTNNPLYLDNSLKILDQLKTTQNLKSRNPGIMGGIAGSYPIWGAYMQYAYINWATKFFADALMLKQTIIDEM